MQERSVQVQLMQIEHKRRKIFQNENDDQKVLPCGPFSVHPMATHASVREGLMQADLSPECMAIIDKGEYCFLSKGFHGE